MSAIPSGTVDSRDSLTIDEWFENLITTGKRVPATSSAIDISKRPDYFDEERYKRAQKLCQKYYTNISMASSTGLILLLQIESITRPLVSTGKSRTIPDLYDRYTATVKYMRKIYETDFVDPTSEGWRYLNVVRKMHERIHASMNQSASKTNSNSSVWVNQYDMALTQFAFIGLFVLQPTKCAAYYIKKEDLLNVVYYWRIISYYFGIEERFNLFVHHDNLSKQTQLLERVFRHQNEELLVSPRNEIGLKMAKGFMLAFEDFVDDCSFNILDHWWHPFVSLSGEKRLQPYTWSDRYKLVFFLLYYKIIFRSETLLGVINHFYKQKFDKFCANGDKIKSKLRKKYNDYFCE